MMKHLIYLLILCMAGLFIFGCEMEPVKPEEQLELNATVEKLAPFGWNANHIVSSSAEIEQVTNISQYLEEGGNSSVAGIGALKKQALNLLSQTKVQCHTHQSLMKTQGDSLIYYEDNEILGIRKALYYNFENGIARYYEVKYKFAAWRVMIYDSSEVRVDLNSTLEDSLDDVLLNFNQLQLFKDNFFIQKITVNANVTDSEGQEITGIEMSRDTDYKSDWFIKHLKQSVKILPNKSGELREDFEYKDGKTSFKKVIFYADNTGEFEEQKRNGTVVTGKFDSPEDDGVGYFEELTDYPPGNYIDKTEKSANILFTLPDSILTINYVETNLFSTGITSTDSASIVTQEQSGTKYTTIEYSKHNGEHGTFNVVENEEATTVEANWTTVENYYILLNAEYYVDGSGHIHFEVYVSEADYNNGGDPILVADYYFSPDGTGTGTLSYLGESYDLTFNESGKAEVTLNGQTTTINLFQ